MRPYRQEAQRLDFDPARILAFATLFPAFDQVKKA
jgi:hypothetical protein